MSHLEIQAIEKKFIKKKVPILRAGYEVRVHQKIKEGGKERVQVFEGLVMGLNAGHGASKTFTVRKVVGGVGVEKIFPLYSPQIAKIEVKKTFKVRRAKLNFLKDGTGMSKRLSAQLGLTDKDELHKKKKGLMEEAVEEVATAPAAEEDTLEKEGKAEAPAAEAVEKEAAPEKAAAPKEEKDEVKEETKEEVKAEAPKEKTEAKTEEKAEEKPDEEAEKKE